MISTNQNNEIDNTINNIEEWCESDLSPQTMFGVASVEEMKKEKAEALAFLQMMEQCHNQMTLKMGIKNMETMQLKE